MAFKKTFICDKCGKTVEGGVNDHYGGIKDWVNLSVWKGDGKSFIEIEYDLCETCGLNKETHLKLTDEILLKLKG